VVQIVHAYFDESGSHSGSPVLCVAGYVFEKRRARRLAADWRAVLGQFDLPYFHMVDCAHGNGIFAPLSKRARIQVATSMIRIIKEWATIGFAVSVDTQAYADLMPSWGPTKSAYSFCARCVIDEIGRWFHQIGFRGKSAYFFEAGHDSRSEADKVIDAVLTNPLNQVNQIHYGYVAHDFVQKVESPAVQAADLLAWQWATDLKHQLAQRPRRKDFESLLAVPVRGAHFTRNRLLYYLEILKEFGVNENHESDTLEQTINRVLYIRRRAQPAFMMLPSIH
jgi:Protein of unknown function (DUF3800)